MGRYEAKKINGVGADFQYAINVCDCSDDTHLGSNSFSSLFFPNPGRRYHFYHRCTRCLSVEVEAISSFVQCNSAWPKCVSSTYYLNLYLNSGADKIYHFCAYDGSLLSVFFRHSPASKYIHVCTKLSRS